MKTRKQGRPPKGEDVKKAAHINTRISEDLRARLDAARTELKRTLSQEIADRLEQSFETPLRVNDTPATRRLCAMIADAISLLEEQTGKFWNKDPFSYQEAGAAIGAILEAWKPPGAIVVPDEFPFFAGVSLALRRSMREQLLKNGSGSAGRHAAEHLIETERMAQETRELRPTPGRDASPWRPSPPEALDRLVEHHHKTKGNRK